VEFKLSNVLARLRNTPTRSSSEGRSVGRRSHRGNDEASLLAEELLARDEMEPDWDRVARAAACRNALERGVDRELLCKIYGQDVVDEASDVASHGRPL
jgi:hypothetical protein